MFPIIFNADENYIPYLAVLMTSIIQNTDSTKTFKEICKNTAFNGSASCAAWKILKDEDLEETEKQEGYIFHIFSNTISKKTEEKLRILEKELAKAYPCIMQIHRFKEEEFEAFPTSGAAHSSKLPYFRLKACAIIQDSKCLYLDSDMLVACDLRELFALDLGDKMLGVVGDCGSKKRKIKYKENKKMRTHYFDDSYFNSGLLLFNTKQCKTLWQETQELARKCSYIKAADQDLLNACVPSDKIFKLPYAWNFQTITFCYAVCKDENPNRLNYTREEFKTSREKPKIYHYGEKPWKYLESFVDSMGRNINDFWWEVAAQTPAFNTELLNKKKEIQEYKTTAALGFEILCLLRDFKFLGFRGLIQNPHKDQERLERINAIKSGEFGLCLILGECVTFARQHKKNVLSLFLKSIKILRDFKKYSKL